MYQSHLIEPERSNCQRSVDPQKLSALLEAWEMAKAAYCDVLRAGVDRTDIELARDGSYRRLLQAGLRIHRLGGSDAVGVVSECLGRYDRDESARHFERLWCGLLPQKAH